MRIKLFGYLLNIEAQKQLLGETTQARLKGDTCKISSDGHSYYLTTPDGYALPYQLSCRIDERINHLTKATIELYINNEIVPYKHWFTKLNDSQPANGDNKTK